jgi:hypothetical protein
VRRVLDAHDDAAKVIGARHVVIVVERQEARVEIVAGRRQGLGNEIADKRSALGLKVALKRFALVAFATPRDGLARRERVADARGASLARRSALIRPPRASGCPNASARA